MNLDLIILKYLVTNKKQALEFTNHYDSKLFIPEYWNFANIVINYLKTYKDVPTLRVLLEKTKNKKFSENIQDIWDKLDLINSNPKEYKHDVEKIVSRFSDNQVIAIRDKLSAFSPGESDSQKSVLDIQKNIKNIIATNNIKNFESKSVKEYLPLFVDKFKAKRKDPKFDIGLMTKYTAFDNATNGLRPADLVLIAGESGFGKSLFLNNIAIQMWMQDNVVDIKEGFTEGKNIIYFSLEMPYEDCFNRFLARLARVPSRILENPERMSKDQFLKIKNALDFIDKYPYEFKIIDISDASANDLEIIYLDSGEDFDAIFIDYLGIMKTNEKDEDQDWLIQGKVAYEIRAIGRKYNKPILSAVQLNRKNKSASPDDSIGLSRLARSGTIATHATHVIQIEKREGEEKKEDFRYHFIKNRKGPKLVGTLIKILDEATLLDMDQIKSDDIFTDVIDISVEMQELDMDLLSK